MRSRLSLRNSLIAATFAMGLTVAAPLAIAGDTGQPPPLPAAPALAPQSVEPQVEEIFNRACSLLSSHKLVGFHAEITFDSVLPSLVKLQYAAAMDVAIERPNRLAINYESDLGAKRLWYDGKTLTILDAPHMVYARVDAPDSIDAMLKWVNETKNVTIPLSGFAYSDPCGRFREQIQRSKYIGLNDVGGIDCDHLGFIGEEADWQLWIDHKGKPVARKMVITYKKLPTEPQWAAVFSDWRFDQAFAPKVFEAKIPTGAIKADFVELKREAQK